MNQILNVIKPDIFKKTPTNKIIKINDICYVKYKTQKNHQNINMLFTKNMLVVVLQGVKILYQKEKSLHVKAGEAFFAAKGAYVGAQLLHESEYRALVFFIDDEFIINFMNKYQTHKNIVPDSHKPDFFNIQLNPLFINCISSIIPYFKYPSRHSQDILTLKLEEMLLTILDTGAVNNALSFIYNIHQKDKLDLFNIIELNYTKPYTLEEFASLTGRSLTSFKTEFKNFYQCSPKKWINQKRLHLAYTLLVHSHKSVSEICFGTGFSNLSHFIQLFRNTYNITPKKLQLKKLAENQQKKTLIK